MLRYFVSLTTIFLLLPRNFGSVESLLQKPATVLLARSVLRVVNVSGVRYLQLALRMARYIWRSRLPQNLIDFFRPWDLSDGVFSRLFLHCLNIDGCAN